MSNGFRAVSSYALWPIFLGKQEFLFFFFLEGLFFIYNKLFEEEFCKLCVYIVPL